MHKVAHVDLDIRLTDGRLLKFAKGTYKKAQVLVKVTKAVTYSLLSFIE